MDKSTVGGLVAIVVILLAAILVGGSITAFIDLPSILIVLLGCVAALYIAFPADMVMSSVKATRVVFFYEPVDPTATVGLLSELSNRARREGLLSLETAADQTDDPFLARGLRMMADGHESAVIETVLFDELAKIEERHKVGADFYDTMGAYGPAMGMIGTLIGLVQMLQNMEDPSSIGPAMAVALLTTLYGSLLANLVGIPFNNKMKIRSGQEIAYKEMIIQGLLSILAGENPRFMVDRLNSSLPPDQRYEQAA